MTKDEALKLALEALDIVKIHFTQNRHVNEAITAIKEALAQPAPVQEPVAHSDGYWCVDLTCKKCYGADFRFKHTTPPQRTWVGLTDKEAMQICVDCGCLSEDWLVLLDAIETKLKEKNT